MLMKGLNYTIIMIAMGDTVELVTYRHSHEMQFKMSIV